MKLSINGTAGIPGCYGGFETLAENLVGFAETRHAGNVTLSVYCSSGLYDIKQKTYRGARLRYLRLKANGVHSVLYDAVSIFDAIRQRDTHMLVLGVSGALVLPLVRLFSRTRIVTNIDGIEWKREKWQGSAKWFLRLSEKLAVRHSDAVIADNEAIAEHVRDTYGKDCQVIAYGGDHALDHASAANAPEDLPDRFALALCRIEPENNVHVILEAVDGRDTPLVFVGNWDNSAYAHLIHRIGRGGAPRRLTGRFSGTVCVFRMFETMVRGVCDLCHDDGASRGRFSAGFGHTVETPGGVLCH